MVEAAAPYYVSGIKCRNERMPCPLLLRSVSMPAHALRFVVMPEVTFVASVASVACRALEIGAHGGERTAMISPESYPSRNHCFTRDV